MQRMQEDMILMKNIIKISLFLFIYFTTFAKEEDEVILNKKELMSEDLANIIISGFGTKEDYCGKICKMLSAAVMTQDSIYPYFSLDSSSKKKVVQSKIDMYSFYYKNELSRTALFMIFRDLLFSDSSVTLLPLRNEKQEKKWRIQTQWSQMRKGEISDGYIFICISQFEAWICDEQ